jgi:hypothetical protein
MIIKQFFLKLLKSNSGVSSRRFIGLLMLPTYILGVVVGIFSKEFNFYITAMIAAAIPLLMAYFLLSWEHIKELASSSFIIKGPPAQNETIVEETILPE